MTNEIIRSYVVIENGAIVVRTTGHSQWGYVIYDPREANA